MKEIYLIRHAEKDAAGMVTERGRQAALDMRPLMPHFAHIISSDSDRTIMTANLLTGESPQIDNRAIFAATLPHITKAITDLANERAISFLDAARQYNDPEALHAIDTQADILNTMIDEKLDELTPGARMLIVSHDLTIVPAMSKRGMPPESIEPLGGFVISDNEGDVLVRRYVAGQEGS